MVTKQKIMIPAINDDGSLFPIEKMEAHRTAQLHLAVSVFVFDGDRLLIQRRALDKYHCGGQWANTCCTHPHWGEETATAAVRRLDEEMGFKLDLTPTITLDYLADVGSDLYEHERVTFYIGSANNSSLKVFPNSDEVCDYRWLNAHEINLEILHEPDNYAPWFKIYMEKFPNFEFKK